MKAEQQMDVGRDNSDREQLTPLLACYRRKKSLQKARDLTIDKRRPIPRGPAEVDVDAMTHPQKLLHLVQSTSSFTREPVHSWAEQHLVP